MLIPRLSTHSQRLERWLGAEEVDRISKSVKDWYGPPIAVAGVPGLVYARGGGDFVGPIRGGHFSNLKDHWRARMRRALRQVVRAERHRLNSGFASLDDMISAATTAGRRRDFSYNKVATIGTANRTGTLFYTAGAPAAGALASGTPGGRACDDSTAGGMPFVNPVSMTQHLINAMIGTSLDGHTTMLYDRLFDVAKTMNSSATEAVTGVPTRYQSTTSTDADYVGGNFAFPETQATLPATGHNHTVWQYTDDAGNTAQSIPSIAGNASSPAGQLDLPIGTWFMPLASGDVGVKALTQLQHSAAIASGALAAVIGHPIAFFPGGSAGVMVPFDGINSAFNLVRIFDDACLASIIMPVVSTAACTYFGTFSTLSN